MVDKKAFYQNIIRNYKKSFCSEKIKDKKGKESKNKLRKYKKANCKPFKINLKKDLLVKLIKEIEDIVSREDFDKLIKKGNIKEIKRKVKKEIKQKIQNENKLVLYKRLDDYIKKEKEEDDNEEYKIEDLYIDKDDNSIRRPGIKIIEKLVQKYPDFKDREHKLYRKLLVQHHPDKFINPKEKKIQDKITKEIGDIHQYIIKGNFVSDVLTNPKNKKYRDLFEFINQSNEAERYLKLFDELTQTQKDEILNIFKQVDIRFLVFEQISSYKVNTIIKSDKNKKYINTLEFINEFIPNSSLFIEKFDKLKNEDKDLIFKELNEFTKNQKVEDLYDRLGEDAIYSYAEDEFRIFLINFFDLKGMGRRKKRRY